MKRVNVKAAKPYDIIIENGLLDRVGECCAAVLHSDKVLLLTDSNVHPLYGNTVCVQLADAGYAVTEYVIPAGEASKSVEQYVNVISTLAQEGFSRSDAIIALGGGVVGDLAGFCAASYLRGIPFVQIPTTLLACVDSSVGGKTAVNLPEGKNLVGAFYQPKAVLCDPMVLGTLPPSHYANGMAEIIKYGMIRDAELLDALERHTWCDEEIIERCVRIKSDIVAQDEFDNGCRQLLNYGHTIGHAVEKCSDFTVLHGEAVAMGMSLMAHAASPSLAQRLDALLHAYALPTTCSFDDDSLFSAALSDKKRRGGTLSLIVVETAGQGVVREMPVEELKEYIRKGRAV